LIRRSACLVACLWAVVAGAAEAPVSHPPAPQGFRLAQWPAAAPAPDFQLIDTHRVERSMRDYRGLVVIVYFGYTHCPDLCPTELLKLSQVLQRLGAAASQVRVLFISLDPERDSPELLARYVAAFDPALIGLTGSAAQINAAAARFAVQFAKVPQGEDYTIDHSTGAYVLDRSGRLRLVGTENTSIADWVHDLQLLVGASQGRIRR